MADVQLKNSTRNPRRGLVFNLTKPTVKVTNQVMVETRDGVRRPRRTTKLVPDSLHIPYGHTVTVPASHLNEPQIAKAIARRDLKVIPLPEPAEKPKRSKKS